MTAARAVRNRRYYERKRRGRTVLPIEVDELQLLAVLRTAGFLQEHEPDPEHDGLAKLLEHVIALWIEPPL